MVLLGIGIAYGPLTLLFLFIPEPDELKRPLLKTKSARVNRANVNKRDAQSAINRDGWIDVLVGLDGTPNCLTSTKSVIETLGPAVRRLQLASVLDIETASRPDAFDTDEIRLEHLKKAAVDMDRDAELILLSGSPDVALIDHAVSRDMDLVVLGHRENLLASTFLGSTVARLARDAALPIVIGPPT